MQRYFIEISYRGTRYHGWQNQPNASTVQRVLEDSYSRVTGRAIHTTGAGRTDTGVHALHFVAHFEEQNPIHDHVGSLIHQVNCVLPEDITIRDLYAVKPGIHARYSALSRTYEYRISLFKDPFAEGLSWYFPRSLNIDLMNRFSSQLTALQDFTSFSKVHTQVKTNFCRVSEAWWQLDGGRLTFTITADRFLRNMVRALVGTLVEAGLGKLDLQDLLAIFEGKDRRLAGYSAPAEGLFLKSIVYPDDIRL
jgi:tRNA pseudouridine38-40 synthase